MALDMDRVLLYILSAQATALSFHVVGVLFVTHLRIRYNLKGRLHIEDVLQLVSQIRLRLSCHSLHVIVTASLSGYEVLCDLCHRTYILRHPCVRCDRTKVSHYLVETYHDTHIIFSNSSSDNNLSSRT